MGGPVLLPVFVPGRLSADGCRLKTARCMAEVMSEEMAGQGARAS